LGDPFHQGKHAVAGGASEPIRALLQGSSVCADTGQLLQQVGMDVAGFFHRHVSAFPGGGSGEDPARWGLAIAARGNYIS